MVSNLICQRGEVSAAMAIHTRTANSNRSTGPSGSSEFVDTRHGLFAVAHKEVLMPVRKSKGGYQYGTKGKVYRGKGAKAKAAKQGRAIKASQNKKK